MSQGTVNLTRSVDAAGQPQNVLWAGERLSGATDQRGAGYVILASASGVATTSLVDSSDGAVEPIIAGRQYVWDTGGLAWVKMSGSSGGVPATSITGNVTVIQPVGSSLHAVLDAGTAVIGHVIADTGSTTAVTGNVTVIQGTGTNLHTVVDSMPTVSFSAPQHVIVDSGAVTSITNPVAVTNANLDSPLSGIASALTTIDTDLKASQPRAVTQTTSPWVVDGTGGTFPVTGTFWQTTQPVSGTVTATQGTNPWIVDPAVNQTILDVLQAIEGQLSTLNQMFAMTFPGADLGSMLRLTPTLMRIN